MKLSVLRQLMQENDNSWWAWFGNIWDGEALETTSIKQYLDNYSTYDDDYELSAPDMLALINIISKNSQVDIVFKLRAAVDNRLMALCAALSQANLLNEANFGALHQLSSHALNQLHTLVCINPILPLSDIVLAFGLKVAAKEKIDLEVIENCLVILGNAKIVTETSLNIVLLHAEHANELLSLLKRFKLTQQIMECFLTITSIIAFNRVHQLLSAANIGVTLNMLVALCDNKHLIHIDEILSLIKDANPAHVTSKLVSNLLTQDVTELILKSMYYRKSYHQTLRSKMLSCWSHVLDQIISLLIKHNLLDASHAFINGLFALNEHVDSVYEVLAALDKIGLVNQETIKIIDDKVLQHPCYFSTAKYAFEKLGDNNCTISSAQLAQILTLSIEHVKALSRSMSALICRKLFNLTTFTTLLDLVSVKLPPVAKSSYVKHSRKTMTGLASSEVTLKDGPSFFMVHGSKLKEGSFGVIKQGQTAAGIVYTIKKLDSGEEKTAAREVRYNRLLGRDAHYFVHKNRPRIVTPWQSGKSLHHFNTQELMAASYETRLYCMRVVLADLDVLHRHNRIHNDIKPLNCILDLDKQIIRLIDFGGAHHVESRRSGIHYTALYTEPNGGGGYFAKDMYAMGLVVMFLFPEIYTIKTTQYHLDITINNTIQASPQEVAIMKLVTAMINPQIDNRCNSEDALAYCDAIIAEGAALNLAKINEAAEKTICRNYPTVASALRY